MTAASVIIFDRQAVMFAMLDCGWKTRRYCTEFYEDANLLAGEFEASLKIQDSISSVCLVDDFESSLTAFRLLS